MKLAGVLIGIPVIAAVVFSGCAESVESETHSGSLPVLERASSGFFLTGVFPEGMDISTISRGDGDWGVVAADEGAVVQLIRFASDRSSARVLGDLPLAEPANLEIDIEASTWLDGWFYVTGSHGIAKNKGTYEASRYGIYRFPGEDPGLDRGNVQSATLTRIFSDDPVLGPHFRKPLQQRGLNIEGLSARNGALYVGLRSPNISGDAFVVRLSAERLFSGEKPDYELLRVHLGAGLGIRAMTAFRDGFLLIAGNAGSESSNLYPATRDYIEGRPSSLFYWVPQNDTIMPVGLFPRVGKGKEESLLVLSDTLEGTSEILVLYDSIKGGGPELFVVNLPGS